MNKETIVSAAREDLMYQAGSNGVRNYRGFRVAISGDSLSESEFEEVKQKQNGTHFEYYTKIEGKRVLIGCTYDKVTE